MIHLHTKFHVPNSSGSSIIAMKPKDKEDFRAVAMLVFYILHELP
jgi:hypothetical protein